MGSPVEATWTGFEGAMYTGAGSGMEGVWAFIALGLCVLAIVLGAAHESSSYHNGKG
ncbi:MAG: hypothetical protein AAGA11_04840 [Pseudomonadota bacterium]